MVQLGALEAPTVEKLIIEFVTKLGYSGGISANFERTEALLLKIFPSEQVSLIMAEIKGASGKRVWASIAQVDPEILASFLRNEYPQTVAVVLLAGAGGLRRQGAHDPAGGVRHRRAQPDAADGDRPEGGPAPHRGDPARRVRLDHRPDPAPGRHEMMADVFNAFDRQTEGRFPRRPRPSQPRLGQAHPRTDVHLRGPAQARSGQRPDADAQDRARDPGPGAEGRQRAHPGFFMAQMSTRAAKN